MIGPWQAGETPSLHDNLGLRTNREATMDRHLITATLLGLAVAMSPVRAAKAAELKVLAGGSMTASLKELAPKFEAATGHKLDITFAATPELIKMSTSALFDLGVVPIDVMKNEEARA